MQKGWKHPKPEHRNSDKGPKLLTSKRTKLDGEWLWWNDGIRLQKVDNEELLWAKKHVLNQWKETKNLENRFEKWFKEMITRMDNLERNMNELKELKNTIRELREAWTSFNSRIDQAEERISEVEDQHNEIKRETKIREKCAKRNEQSPRNVKLCEET